MDISRGIGTRFALGRETVMQALKPADIDTRDSLYAYLVSVTDFIPVNPAPMEHIRNIRRSLSVKENSNS